MKQRYGDSRKPTLLPWQVSEIIQRAIDLFMQLLYFRSVNKQLQSGPVEGARSEWNAGSPNYQLQL